MVLAIDIGNSNIVLGCMEAEAIRKRQRINTRRKFKMYCICMAYH